MSISICYNSLYCSQSLKQKNTYNAVRYGSIKQQRSHTRWPICVKCGFLTHSVSVTNGQQTFETSVFVNHGCLKIFSFPLYSPDLKGTFFSLNPYKHLDFLMVVQGQQLTLQLSHHMTVIVHFTSPLACYMMVTKCQVVLIPYFSHLLSPCTQSSRGDGEVHRGEAKTFCLKLGFCTSRMHDCLKSIARTWSSSPAIYQWQNSQNKANILNPIVLTKLLGVSVCSHGRQREGRMTLWEDRVEIRGGQWDELQP